MRLAFKKSSGFTGKLIDWLSGGDGFCHVELIFSDGISFSSTTMDEEKPGVRFKQIAYSHPQTWVFVELAVTEDQEAQMVCKAIEIEHAPYDYRGVARFVLPWMPEHPTAYFCSESVLTALQAGGLFPGIKPHKVSPNRLYEMAKERK
jgi:hypothetical protein